MNRKKLFYLASVFVLFVVFVVFAFFSQGFSRTPLITPINLALDFWPGNFWMQIADNKGYFKELDLSVNIVNVHGHYDQSIEDLAEGWLDFHVISLFDLVDMNFEGYDLVALLTTDLSLEAEGIVAKDEHQSLFDLKNKRIGVEFGSYLEFYLDVALTSVGIADEDYEKVSIITDNVVNVYDDLNLDAAMLWHPALGEISKLEKWKILFKAKNIRGLSPAVLTTRRSFAEVYPNKTLQILKAWEKATNFIKNNPDEALEIIADYGFMTELDQSFYTLDQIKELFSGVLIQDVAANKIAFLYSDKLESLYGNIYYINQFLKEKGVFSTRLKDPEDLLMPVFFDQLAANYVR